MLIFAACAQHCHGAHQWDMSVPAAAEMGSVRLPGCSCGQVDVYKMQQVSHNRNCNNWLLAVLCMRTRYNTHECRSLHETALPELCQKTHAGAVMLPYL